MHDAMTMEPNIVMLLLVIVLLLYGLKYFLFRKNVKRQMDQVMRTLTQGTTILNHSIKNEVQKLRYLSERIKDYVNDNKPEAALQSIDSLFTITDHIHNMVGRIKEKTDDIVLIEENNRLIPLIDSTVASLQPMIENNNITICKEYQYDVELVCDPLHVREVFNNICLNAIEAIRSNEGSLYIRTDRIKNDVFVEVADNGIGIPEENLVKVLEPFFTTKKNSTNYGLGLSYCDRVMKQHGGSLIIVRSEMNKGTTVRLCFPKKRIVNLSRIDRKQAAGVTAYVEQN
jgi:two-component system sporulation sensor kinase B